ncbi:MAG: hypothetical protein HYT87_14680 [Nitrospirae bacterium]|nr:hypothetical protein [Nitrospirota bacterium]
MKRMTKRFPSLAVLMLLCGLDGPVLAGEHAGAEHAGKKAEGFTAEEIKAVMTRHIQGEIKKAGGVFKITDSKTKEALSLEFVKIHDPVRKIEGKGYFACTDFHPAGAETAKLYDLDFWLNPKDGKLVVTDTRIHKHPVRKGSAWEKEPRYTFVNDNPVEVR